MRLFRFAERSILISSTILVHGIAWGQETIPREPTDTQPDSVKWFGITPAPLESPLVTDRPDFTESTDSVPRGHLQIEMGYTFTYDSEDEDRSRDHTMPEFLLRIGVVDNFEFRIGWSGYSWSRESTEIRNRVGRRVRESDWQHGSNDIDLGFKLKLLEQDGVVPHFGVLASTSIPTGSADTTVGDVEPSVGLLWAYDLTESLAVAGNINFASLVEDHDRFFQAGASLSLALALSERVGSYVEYFGLYPNAENKDSAHFFNSGFTYLINDNFQIDVRAGFGLNEEADDFFSGIGFAWRI